MFSCIKAKILGLSSRQVIMISCTLALCVIATHKYYRKIHISTTYAEISSAEQYNDLTENHDELETMNLDNAFMNAVEVSPENQGLDLV